MAYSFSSGYFSSPNLVSKHWRVTREPLLNHGNLEMLILIPAEESGAALTGVRQLSQASKHKANNLPFVSGPHTVGMGLPVSAKAIRTCP